MTGRPTFFVAGGNLASAAGNRASSVPFLELDSTVELMTDFKGSVTSHPVESGSRITDHFSRENPRFTLRGVTSNTPVLEPAYNNVAKSHGKRTKNVYDVLYDIYSTGALFTLVADLDSYPNCVIKSFGFTQNAQQAEALYVDLQIEQLRIVTSRRVAAIIPNQNPVVAQDSTDTNNQGVKSGRERDFPELRTPVVLSGEG